MQHPHAQPLSDTCWSLIEAARSGESAARSAFTHRYLPVVRAYLAARWRGSPLFAEIDDAVQEVFLACFRQGGALDSLDPSRGTGFRAYLFGIVRNIALHAETRRARDHDKRGDTTFDPETVAAREASLSRIFDREWARAVVREAADLQSRRARDAGAEARRRIELLRLRFQDGKPIRDIAVLWQADPVKLHHDYAQARKEFLAVLREVLGLHERCSAEQLKAECHRILELLG